MSLERSGPLLVADRFAPLGRELIKLLLDLPASAWTAPTVARAWTVKDIVAHLLDTALRRISLERDGWSTPPPGPIESYDQLVGFLNDLNHSWVEPLRRVSPRSLIEMMTLAEANLAALLSERDPFSTATFAVSWAGEDSSKSWFDIARELTERWLHQQQIRLAVGAPPLADRFYAAPVFETFLRALPPRYAALDRPPATTVALTIGGPDSTDRSTSAAPQAAPPPAPLRFALRRGDSGWSLWRGTPATPATTIEIPEEAAWLLFTKGITGAQARERSTVSGDLELLAPVFSTLAIMA